MGCIADALSFAEYEDGLRAAGFTDISITSIRESMSGVYSAIVQATKRLDESQAAEPVTAATRELPVVRPSCC